MGNAPRGCYASPQGWVVPLPEGDVAAQAFPVGSVFISVLPTNPATVLGYGSWTELPAGFALVTVDPEESAIDAAEKTDGQNSRTPAGTVSQPTFTGQALAGHSHGAGTLAPSAHAGAAVADHAAHTHAVTSNVAVGDHAAHTHAVTSNVAVGDHASHTHTYTEVPNHTHPHNIQGGTTGATTGTNVMASTATGGNVRAMAIATANPTGGVATGTTAGPNATMTHSVTNNQVTSGNPSSTLSHSVTNNQVTSGNPSATLSHSVTQPSDHTMSGSSQSVSAGTPAGTISQPVFNGAAMSVRQKSIAVHAWKRAA